ncbi:MAG: DUF6096 family protein [Lachnospiraceae bacterium]|nr:DUF6096 family protein [Lachnospiraceae bacterium]
MKKFYTLTVGEKSYQLRLTIKSIRATEEKLGSSMFSALGNLKDDSVGTITTILWGALQAFNPGFTEDDAATLIDEYIDEDNSIDNMLQIITDVFEVSGLFKKGQA